MKQLISFCLCLVLCGCGSRTSQDYLNLYGIAPPQNQNFNHCFNYGCQTHVNVILPHSTEKKLKKLFGKKTKNAKSERDKISKAIQIFEIDVGNITGTKNDKFGTFRLYQDDAKTTENFQQDCIDESTNTTIYLTLLSNMGLLRFHKPGFPTTRQPFANGNRWWHQTAVIEEITTGEKYAVDSWFFDNGYPAAIVPMKEWKAGWHPPKDNK